jgi:signal transduction histidine kinase
LPDHYEHPIEEMTAYVRFHDEDRRALGRLWAVLEHDLPPFVDAFYERLLSFPGTAGVFRDDAQVERLKGTMQVWVRELLNGPWDEAYYERRTRIGSRHVAVGLAHRYMFTAMSGIRDHLCDLAHQHFDRGEARAMCAAVGRVTTLDLAIMTGTYMSVREAEQLAVLQSLIVGNLPSHVLLVDHGGLVTASTRPGLRLLDATDVTVGRPWFDSLPAALLKAAALPEVVARALQSRNEVRLVRVDVALDGRMRSFAINVVPLDHPVAAFLLHVDELTATVDAEQRARQAEALAQIGALSAGVAHELRNPLAGISGAIQVIAGSLDDGDRRRAIMDKVLGQITRLNRMVSDLLAFARPREVALGPVDLAEQAESVADVLRSGHPGAVVTVAGQGAAWADADHVHRVLLNLAENGLQAQGGEGRVHFEVRPGTVCVADDGPGVPVDVAERVFEPFFTTRTQGTGLGLAICRSSAEAMGGRLVLERTGPLRGACFRLCLRTSEQEDSCALGAWGEMT